MAALGTLLISLLLPGCIRNEVVVRVKPDGTGHVVVTRVFPAEVVSELQEMIDTMRKHGGKKAKPPPDPFFNEKAIKGEAVYYGEGVTFVKAQKLDKDGARGWVALYAFTNVDTVSIPIPSDPSSMIDELRTHVMQRLDSSGDDEADAEPPDEVEIVDPDNLPGDLAGDLEGAFTFKLTRGPEATLQVTTPDYPAPTMKKPEPGAKPVPAEAKDEDEPDDTDGIADYVDPESGEIISRDVGDSFMAEARGELENVRISLLVEVNGQVVKSTAAYPVAGKPTRFVLLDLDGPKILTSSGLKQYGQDLMEDGSGEALETLINAKAVGVAGVTLDTNKVVTVRFK